MITFQVTADEMQGSVNLLIWLDIGRFGRYRTVKYMPLTI